MDAQIKKLKVDLVKGDNKKGKKDASKLLKMDKVQDKLVSACKDKKGKSK